MAKSKQTDKADWELIEREYRTGRFTVSQLEKRHGPHRSTITRRAKKHGWQADLSARVTERTAEKIRRETLPPEAIEVIDREQELYARDEAVVEYAATENASVVKGHRKQTDRWRRLVERYSDLLGEQLDSGKITVEIEGQPVEIDAPLEYFGKCLGHGTQALERLVKMERKSFGLDDEQRDDEAKTFEELMAEVAPDDD